MSAHKRRAHSGELIRIYKGSVHWRSSWQKAWPRAFAPDWSDRGSHGWAMSPSLSVTGRADQSSQVHRPRSTPCHSLARHTPPHSGRLAHTNTAMCSKEEKARAEHATKKNRPKLYLVKLEMHVWEESFHLTFLLLLSRTDSSEQQANEHITSISSAAPRKPHPPLSGRQRSFSRQSLSSLVLWDYFIDSVHKPPLPRLFHKTVPCFEVEWKPFNCLRN